MVTAHKLTNQPGTLTMTVSVLRLHNTQSLQERRDFLVATFYKRVQRLDAEQHPVAAALREWQSVGTPFSVGHRAAFLPRGAALCRRLCRYSEFDDSDSNFLEQISTPPPKKATMLSWAPKDKERAKAHHLNFVRRLSAQDVIIYADGSAVPNPGKIGLGIHANIGGHTVTHAAPIGIGSNITAELHAILVALQKTPLTAGLDNHHRVFIFSDCVNALDLTLGTSEPTHSFELVHEIRAELSKLTLRIPVVIKWVPAHVGVPGNEAANRAAQNGANMVLSCSPAPNQPPITRSTSRGFVKQAQKRQLQRRWFSIVSEKSGTEHLSRLKADVSASPAFFVGTRKEQTI